MAMISPLFNVAGKSIKESLVAAEVKRMSDGTPSLVWIILCTLIPPFFLPVLGCLPTPLKSRLEKRVIVVESIIFSRFIHFGSFFLVHSRPKKEDDDAWRINPYKRPQRPPPNAFCFHPPKCSLKSS